MMTMRWIHGFRASVFAIGLLSPFAVRAATYYVAPGGADGNSGTIDLPFATVGRAQTAAAAGDTVFIRGGTYAFSGTGTLGVSFTKSGQAGALISYFAYPSEIPVFDLTGLTPSGRVTGLDVNCSYVHLRGLELRGVHQYASGQDSWGVRIRGSNNILENLDVHHNDAPGIFITSGANNLILNCDSHHNYDFLESGGSGDGFGCHSSGGGNVMRGCRAFDNSDDGYDFINAAGSCTVEQSFSFRNGWQPGTATAAGNGAGFKAGGYGSLPVVPATGAATHVVRQCVAFGNRSQGFYANHHPGRIEFFNNTAFRNSVNYNMLADSGYPSDHVIRNNIAMSPGTAINNLTGGSATFNSWNLSVTVSAADFVSVSEAEAQSPRAADGSLPAIGLVHLVAGSDLIDAGTDVGLPSTGAPDLGAFEYGGDTGGTGTGGASTGGAPTGGVSTGGALTGGMATGGASTGGLATGGLATGGLATGGDLTGGLASGGASTGGLDAGGATTGGATTGGATTGGATTGGATTGGAAASGGTGGAAPCTSPLTPCGAACVDTTADPSHCGACGVVCGATEVCSLGACTPTASCTWPLVLCGDSCVDVASDATHCGACGTPCAAPSVCSAGACTASGCAAGLTQCGQACVDLTSDLLHCGACGVTCLTGQLCTASVCTGTPTGQDPTVPSGGCAAGLTACGQSCVDLASSTLACGACGIVCTAGQSCVSGQCTAPTAPGATPIAKDAGGCGCATPRAPVGPNAVLLALGAALLLVRCGRARRAASGRRRRQGASGRRRRNQGGIALTVPR